MPFGSGNLEEGTAAAQKTDHLVHLEAASAGNLQTRRDPATFRAGDPTRREDKARGNGRGAVGLVLVAGAGEGERERRPLGGGGAVLSRRRRRRRI